MLQRCWRLGTGEVVGEQEGQGGGAGGVLLAAAAHQQVPVEGGRVMLHGQRHVVPGAQAHVAAVAAGGMKCQVQEQVRRAQAARVDARCCHLDRALPQTRRIVAVHAQPPVQLDRGPPGAHEAGQMVRGHLELQAAYRRAIAERFQGYHGGGQGLTVDQEVEVPDQARTRVGVDGGREVGALEDQGLDAARGTGPPGPR